MLFLLWSLLGICFAGESNIPYYGVAVGGFIELSGFAKKLVLDQAIPIGSIQSSYGYEVWDTTHSSSDPSKVNRVTLCSSSIELSLNSAILGIGFGGEMAHFKTVGICDGQPRTLAGEEIDASLSYDLAEGQKTVPVKVSFHFNLTVSLLLDQLEKYFREQPSARSPSMRLNRLFKHMIEVTANLTAQKADRTVNRAEMLLFKILMHTFLKLADDHDSFTLSKDELASLKAIQNLDLREFPAGLLDELYRAPEFYQLKDPDANEVYLDFVNFKEYFLDALYDADFCHMLDFSVDLGNVFDLELLENMPVSLAVSYGDAMVDREYHSNLSLEALAAFEFSRHRFVSHSEECKTVSSFTGLNFGRLIGLFRPRKNLNL